jgi:truncated hemoglobin YjbI
MTGTAPTTDPRPLPLHPSEHMTPERFARWAAALEQAAAERGLPPGPWPLPPRE